jgi:integrase
LYCVVNSCKRSLTPQMFTRCLHHWPTEMPKSTQLTAIAIAKLKPRPARREVPDRGAKGLALAVQPSGSKSWVMRFRRPDGRPGSLTLGPYDASQATAASVPVLGQPLTLAGARALAAEINRQRATGADVVATYSATKERQRQAAAQAAEGTFGGAARAFIDEHARPNTRRWEETARILGLDYSPDGTATLRKGGLAARWQTKPLEEVTSDAIYALVDEAKQRGIPGQGRRNTAASNPRGRKMASALSTMFGWLLEHRKIKSDPTLGVHCPKPPAARERVLSNDEIRSFWQACDQLGAPFGNLFKFLLLTGARRDEASRMTYAELQDANSIWLLPGSRTKNKRPHIVPLAPFARALLGTGTGFVFTTNGRTPVSGFSKIKARLDQAMPSIEDWVLHDLRRTAATGMAELGVQPHIVEAVLNHVSGAKAGVAGIYNRAVYADEKRDALELWAAHVQGLVA